MFTFSSHLNLANGERSSDWIELSSKTYSDGVTAVFATALACGNDGWRGGALSSEAGLCINMTPNRKIRRFMADYRYSLWWCRPAFGTDLKEVPDETQLLMLEKEDGSFCAVVPVVNDTCRCVLKGVAENTVSARLSSWCEDQFTCDGLAFVYMEGENPQKLVSACVKRALQILNSGVRHISRRRYPELMEYLGWCSWDSMQIRVNEEGLLHKCQEFQKKDIPVRWVILDDMWAHIQDFYGRSYADKDEMIKLMHHSALYDFEADPKRFPHGLAGCIEKIKEYGLSVGMWHPTTGYWRGIDPRGKAFEKLKDYLIQVDGGVWVPDWHKEKSYLYYKTIHDFFRQCGADFVKIDKQSMTSLHYKNLAPVGQCAKEYHAGMEASVGEHFDNCMINCMGMSSEDMWSRSVSAISRCSDDFQPEDAAWFTKHVMQCAYNSMLQGQFYWCDWDMWWTDDSQSTKNSIMRAISGGPIYVSDELDRSRAEVLKPLALSDGRILRCDRPAVPTADCVTVDPVTNPHAMKIQNTAGEYGVMAVFNITDSNEAVTACISGSQIDGFDSEEYAVYDYFEQSIVLLKGAESFQVTLKDREAYKLYLFVPLKNGFGAIGRTDKFIAPRTIRYVHGEDVVLVEEGPYAVIKDGKLYQYGE